MALLFDGIQNLAGQTLPNVKIENVTLSVGSDPEPESNPHINSSREYVSTGISSNKLVQNTSTSLTEKQIQNKNLFVDVTLSILNIENDSSSLILNQINYLDFVYVKIIQSLSQNLTNELLQANFPVNYTSLKNGVDYTEKVFSLKDFYENKTLTLQINNSNDKVYKHTKDVRITSKNPQKQHIDIFAYAYVNIEELINKFELNIASNYEVKGNVSKESVINDSKVISDSYILTDQNNNLFIGTPIKGVNGKFYSKKPTSVTQESLLQPLNVVSVSNKKIVDLRETISLQTENTINIQPPKINNFLNLQSLNQKKFLSDLYLSRQTDNTYSGFFAFDIIAYLKENSSTPEIYDDPKCLQFIRVKKLNLIRKRVKTIDSVVYTFNEYTPDKRIISTSEQSFGSLTNKISFVDYYNNLYTTSIEDLNNNEFGSTLPSFTTIESLKKIASISEILVPTASNFRVFTFTDFEVSTLTTGEYRYEVNIEIEDNTIELIKNNVVSLNSAKTKVINYLSESERVDMFSTFENKQTKKFISFQNSKYSALNVNNAIQAGVINQDLTIQNSPWIYVPSIVVAIEKDIFLNDISNRATEFYNMLNPATTSPTKINYILNYIETLLSKITQKYSLDEQQNKNSNSNKSNVIKTLNITQTFNNVVDSELKKVGIDFIQPDLNTSLFNIGLPRVQKSNFDLRVQNEIKKYFPSTTNLILNTISSDFNTDEQNSLSDIFTYSTCYFSPSNVMLNNKQQISLSSTDSTNLELNKYDTIVKTSISTTSQKIKDVGNQLLSATNIGLSTIKNFSSNLSSNIQLSFITKPSLFVDSQNIFDNSGFYTADRTFNIQDLCYQSNEELKNEENLSQLSPLINSLLDQIIRPNSADDATNDVSSINTIDKFNILSSTSIINKIKEKSTIEPQNTQTNKTALNSLSVGSVTSINTAQQNIKVSKTPLNSVSILSGISQPNITTNQNENSFVKIPLQTKSLMLGNVTQTKFNLNSFNFDPFLHPSTKNFMRLNFQTICQTEYLAGFENSDISKPVWKLLTKQDYDQLKGLVIIKTKQYNNKLLNIGTEKGFEYDIYNEFCIIEKEQLTPTLTAQPNNIIPNINVIFNNRSINTDNILTNLNISFDNQTQNNVAKQLIVLNTIDKDVRSSYTFSKLEINNGN